MYPKSELDLLLDSVKESVEKQNDVVLRFATHVIATTTSGTTSNLVFSPALTNVILSLIAARSPGETKEKILSLLQASSTDELNDVSSKIVTSVLADSTANGGPMISAANGFWIEKSLPVDSSFKNLLENSYKAAFNQVDFRAKGGEVAEEVNSWVEKETKGLITNLLPPGSVTPLTDSIFANALFFDGRWDKEFDPSLTKDAEFYLLDGKKVRVPFMKADFRKHVYAYEGFKVLELDYREGRIYTGEDDRGDEEGRRFLMTFYLPDEKDGLPLMLEKLASTDGILNGEEDIPSHYADVKKLKIPKFKFGFNFEASEALKEIGLNMPLDTIIHKSCIEVDEVGSKAAAAAAIIGIGGCGPAPKEYDFIADHPFLFTVTEARSGLVLFIGQVLDPSLH